MTTTMQIQQYPDPEKLALGAAEFICNLAKDCIAESGGFSLVLAGGSTPENTYRQLVNTSQQLELEWSSVQFYWGDERCVPPDHDQSNFRMAQQALLDHIEIPEGNLHRMACELDPVAGAETYEQLLRTLFVDQAFPCFDLILLGLGEDGHTASLFPGADILEECYRWVAPVFIPHPESWRISLTLPAINAARHVAFLVSGEAKAATLRKILETPTPKYPANRIAPQGELTWFIDHAAGKLLKQSGQ
jgi:6-phosphogluconolactonase